MNNDLLRLALVQDNPVVGDLAKNSQKIYQHLRENSDVDLVVFPECFVSGYPLNDLVLRPGFLHDVERKIASIRSFVMEMNGPSVLVGAPLAGANLPYNAAYLIEPSGATRVVRKTELPNSDVFDERRTFASASEKDIAPISFRGFSLGIQICEDMWHGRVSRILADELADVLISINGSPYNRGKNEIRQKHAKRRMSTTGLPVLYVNMIGGQDELVFDGGSFAMNRNGGVMAAKAFAADTMRVNLRRDEDGQVQIQATNETIFSSYPADDMEADYLACVLGLRDYVLKTGAKRVFVGVSGGLDSALVLTQAVDALGAKNVTGIMMPSKYTGDESLTLADELMERLGVNRMILPIGDSFDAANTEMLKALEGQDNANTGIMAENLQARLRGMFLMAMTNALGGLVLSTGNKSEMAVGYATLYGDMNGGYNPMKSVYKSKAFDMARWRNGANAKAFAADDISNPIPDGIISRPPTAELAEGQEDSKSLGDYRTLDMVLETIIEHRQGVIEAAKRLEKAFSGSELRSLTTGLSAEEYAEKIARLVRIAQYKRNQSPPGVKLNTTDFGLGWRYPIAGTYSL